jgi:DNA replicative helicase MCM subunit Mcm2 (Cdc46/Mcm family)
MDNVDLTEAILSRFDILCVIRDTVDPITLRALTLAIL